MGRGFSSREGITNTMAIGNWINETEKGSVATIMAQESTKGVGRTTCDTGKVSCSFQTNTNMTARGKRIAKKGKARQNI